MLKGFQADFGMPSGDDGDSKIQKLEGFLPVARVHAGPEGWNPHLGGVPTEIPSKSELPGCGRSSTQRLRSLGRSCTICCCRPFKLDWLSGFREGQVLQDKGVSDEKTSSSGCFRPFFNA